MTQKQALTILKSGVNVFLTGEPGSGKTYTVNQYVRYLHSHGVEPSITASTGIAATHIHGMTIHSWCGIGVREKLDKNDLNRIAGNARIEKRLARAKILLIDEISMLNGNTLDMVDAVCRRIKESQKPFGGIQVVCIGDFFQLPPVNRHGADANFAFTSNAWTNANPTVCYLSEQHRQEDLEFTHLLADIRAARITEKTFHRLRERTCDTSHIPESVPRLHTHNFAVDTINNEKLKSIVGASKKYLMGTRGAEHFIQALKRGCLSPETMYLKIGASVMFTKNSPSGHFVNGTLGVVIDFDPATKFPVVKSLHGKRITAEPMDWKIEENGKVRASITQIPLRLAWALTIHKCQGMTMDAALIDLSQAFEYGQGYVALSRLRSFSGLYLLGCNEHALRVHPKVSEIDYHFRRMSDTACAHVENISPEKWLAMHDNFIRDSGGSITVRKESKNALNTSDRLSTYELTKHLIGQKMSLEDIAKMRGFAYGTILNHIEKMLFMGILKTVDLQYLREKNSLPQATFDEIRAVFSRLGNERLKPIYEHFSGVYDYKILRFIRLFL